MKNLRRVLLPRLNIQALQHTTSNVPRQANVLRMKRVTATAQASDKQLPSIIRRVAQDRKKRIISAFKEKMTV